MSVSRKSRKVKLVNREDQPQILQFMTDVVSDISSPRKESKKRRRSTGEKSQAKKRVDSPCGPKTLASSNTEASPQQLDTTTHVDNQNNIVCTLSKMNMEETNGSARSTSPMLDEIMKMEARLTARITTNRDKEITDMEARLNSNIKSTIDTSIKNALKVMETSICTAIQNNPLIQSHNTEIKELKEENIRLNRRVHQLTNEQDKMKRQINKIEARNLDRSMIFRGLIEETKEMEASIVQKIHQALISIMSGESDEEKLESARQIGIVCCRRLGRFNKHRSRAVSVEFKHKEDTDFIFENRFDLIKGVYVDREYPAETEKKRKTLLPILKAAKRLPGYKRQSKLENDKLVLKGRPYTVSMLNQLPDELNAFKVTSKEDTHTVGFFGEINPLSNFHDAPFVHDGTRYISSEQFIQANKAKYFGDTITQEAILGCTTSLECKILSKQIRNYEDVKWDEVAGNVCYPGLLAKFQQNPHAMDTLIRKTGSKRIVECATDRLWATGIPLNDPNCLDETRWTSQGILGQMLESIRHDTIHCQIGSKDATYHHPNFSHSRDQALSSRPETHQFHSGAGSMEVSDETTYKIPYQTGLPAESLSERDSTSGSASTSPTSDTTASATDTDPGDGPREPLQVIEQIPSIK